MTNALGRQEELNRHAHLAQTRVCDVPRCLMTSEIKMAPNQVKTSPLFAKKRW